MLFIEIVFIWNFYSQSTLMLFLFCCKGGGEVIWIDPPPFLDPRFRRAPLELSCVGFEFRIIFILRCRFPCCTGRAYSLVICMNIRRFAWPCFLNVTVVIETALVSFIWRPITMVFSDGDWFKYIRLFFGQRKLLLFVLRRRWRFLSYLYFGYCVNMFQWEVLSMCKCHTC